MPGGPLRCCLEPRSSFSRCSAALPRRRPHTTSASLVLRGDQLGPVQETAHQTFRVRKHGSKPLPLPPLLDPVVLAERARWEQPKAKPNVAAFTPFQKKLWESPYAHVLASPLRLCRSTMVLFPSELLTTLHARPHPTTSDPWLLPVSLTTPTKHLGAPHRFLARSRVVEQLGRKRAWKNSLNQRFTNKMSLARTKDLVWREDMAPLITSLMRTHLLAKLRWTFARAGRLTPVKSPAPADIDAHDNVACVLFFGSLATQADALHARAADLARKADYQAVVFATREKALLDPHEQRAVTHPPPRWWTGPVVPRLQSRVLFPPLEFRTTLWRGARVPVYSLVDLLGEGDARQMLDESEHHKDVGVVVMKGGRHNVPVLTELMKLEAFLAEPGP